MKLNKFETIEKENSIFVNYYCNFKDANEKLIYFKFSKNIKRFLLPDFTSIAVALLIPSMKLGEDLIINGEISERTYLGMNKIIDTMYKWDIGLNKIKIIPNKLKREKQTVNEIGMFFSGGVDSFYSYLKNKNSQNNKIKHFILVKGYDIALDNETLWKLTLSNIEKIAISENINLIVVESNIRELIDSVVSWDFSHGGCLAAVALLLRGKFSKIYLASSYHFKQLFPWGSHPQIDKYWSTEKTTIIHDGSDTTRVEKVKSQIAKSTLALKYLRVCYTNYSGLYNCGRCDKCLRTMINLKIAGVLDKSKTFPHSINLNLLSHLNIDGEHGAIFHKENLSELIKMGNQVELVEVITNLLRKPFEIKKEPLVIRLLAKLTYYDSKFNKRRIAKIKQYLYDFFP